MATCVKPDFEANLVVDSATPLESCTMLLLDAGEFQSAFSTRITSQADAEAIGGSLALLLAVAFIWRTLRRALDVGDYSDEKH